MDAPVFRPAKEFTAPKLLPQELNTTTSSLEALFADPVAAAIVSEEAPTLKFMADLDQVKPYLDIFALQWSVQLNLVTQEQVDRIAARLQAEISRARPAP